MKHVHEIKGRYAVRVGVPAELRGIVGKRELREWLGGDRKSAERNAHAVIDRFLSQIEAAKAQLAASAPSIRSAAQAHYASELLADDAGRRGGTAPEVQATAGFFRAHQASLMRLLAAGQLPLEEANALLGWAADDLVAQGKASAGDDRMALLRALAEVQLEALARFEERDQGKLALTKPSSPLLAEEGALEGVAAVDGSPKRRAIGKPLAELLTAFHGERRAGNGSMSEKTMEEHKVAVRMFEEFLGQKADFGAITQADVLAYKRALMQTPANYRQRFPGKSLPDAIAANSKLKAPFPTLNPATINNKWLAHLNTILGWGAKNGFGRTDNPAQGIKVDEGKGFKEPTRVPFSQDDLGKLFGTDLFADPAAFGTKQWALLVALYTGARSSSEVARIKLSDIYEEQGTLVFDLIEATKNTHSKRLVPVHRVLINLGLPAYVDQLRKAGKTRLFSDWEPEDKINRWFLRTYKQQVGIEDSRKVFHSFRHSLKTALARYGVNRDVSDLITGHKDQSVGGIYIGDASLTMIAAMTEGINRVTFGLTHLEGKQPA